MRRLNLPGAAFRVLAHRLAEFEKLNAERPQSVRVIATGRQHIDALPPRSYLLPEVPRILVASRRYISMYVLR